MNLRLIAALLVVAGLAWGSLIAWLLSALAGVSPRSIVRVIVGVVALAVLLVAIKDQWLERAAEGRERRRRMSPEWLAYMRGDRSPGSAE